MTATAIQSPTPHNAFQQFKTGDPLANVGCHCDDQKVTLTGCVTRFYHVQLAVEAARRLAEGRKIDIRIEVVNPPKSNLSANDNDFK